MIEKNQKTFGSFPWIQTIYCFVMALLAILVVNPILQIITLVSALCCLACLQKSTVVYTCIGACIAIVVISTLNPLFNTDGSTVLFTYGFDRPYTLEALLYGFTLAFSFVSVCLWLMVLGLSITSQDVSYMFHKATPALSLVFVLTLQWIPRLIKQFRDVHLVRKVNSSQIPETLIVRIQNSGKEITTVLSCSFEEAFNRAQSMESRGYGLQQRSFFHSYHRHFMDVVMACTAIACFIGFVVFDPSQLLGLAQVSLAWEHVGSLSALGFISYGIFCFLPTLRYLIHSLIWHYSSSNI